MTLAQLQSFVLVARHGSVKAAAAELSVTEPAVSVAVSALRKELGDDLFVRSGRGIALTPGGRRLAALANEILALAAQAQRELKGSGPLGLRVVATDVVAEHIGPLIELFGSRETAPTHPLEITVETGDGASFVEALEHRRADIALGPNPVADRVASAPFLRCRLILVAAPDHPLAAQRGIVPSALAGERWLVGQPELDPTTATGLFLTRHGLEPPATTYSSGSAAIAAAAAGEGIALTPAHAVIDEVRRRALVRLDVRGTPVIEMWHASTLGLGRALPAALAFQRFATTPEATQAISSGRAGAISDRARPKVHVTLWSSVAARRG